MAKRILVVDDNPSYLELVSEALASENEIVIAETSEGALAQVRGAEPFDHVVTDWHLGGSGSNKIYASELAEETLRRKIPLTIHSGTDDGSGTLNRLLEHWKGKEAKITRLTKGEKDSLQSLRRSIEG